MLRQFSTRRIVSFFLVDWLGTLGLLWAASLLRSEIGFLPPVIVRLMETLRLQTYGFWADASPTEILPSQVYLLVSLIWPFFFLVFSVYDGRHNSSLKNELLNTFLAVCVSTLTLAGVLFFTYRESPRLLIAIFFLFDLLLLLGIRVIWSIVRNGIAPPVAQKRQILIIGAGPVGVRTVKSLKQFAWPEFALAGYLDDDPEKIGESYEGLPVLGSLDDTLKYLETSHITDAVVALPLHAHDRLVDICKLLQSHSVQVHVIPDLFALSFPSYNLDGFGGIPVIDLGKPGIHGMRRLAKRGFDVIAVTLGLIFLSPLLGLIALLIKLDSKGPVVFKQERIGENGRAFTMYKFRSMYADADPAIHKAYMARLIQQNLSPDDLGEEGDSGSLKLKDDPRITKVGKFIRKTSLDELPQLFNVLFGDMSLVGPRPPVVYEVDMYEDWHKRRFEVPPGVTGLWQVKGRNIVSFDEMIRMDIEYVEHQSIWLDIKLLLQTPLAVITGKGAG